MKIKEKIEKIEKIRDYLYNTLLGNVLFIVFIAGFFFGIIYFIRSNNYFKKTNEVDMQKIMEVIKKLESEKPSRISENPTEKEVYNNNYIKSIRTGLNGYLDGTNTGVEEYSIKKSSLGDGKICGLNSFDKLYYKSKFIVISASNNDYGGIQANIFFIDKPDTLFWAWVYGLGGDEYVLRGFCESNLSFNQKSLEFTNFIEGMIKRSKYSL